MVNTTYGNRKGNHQEHQVAPVKHRFRITLKIILSLLVFTFQYGIFYSAQGSPFGEKNPEGPWHITANEIHQDKKTAQYIAKGDVIISRAGRKIYADFIRFDQKNMKVYAKGHVVMTAGQDILTGNRMDMDLDKEIGTLYNGTVFLSTNHYYIKGDRIEKIGKNSYSAQKATITTCDGDKPAWRITGRKFKVTVDGYGHATHATLWTSKVPVLYTPFFMFPAKTKRQTGLLQPQIGHSNRKHEEYVQPFFWAINDQSDATFYEHYMGLRGNKLGVEYRYVNSSKSKGTLMFDFLKDKKTDDGSLSNKNWAYFSDAISRPNKDRYWFRMKSDQEMPFGFSAMLDLDIVSDQDYLHEFKDGYTGFFETERYYNKNFNRDIEEYDDAIRTNSLKLNKSWDGYSLNASVIWYDDIIRRRQTGSGYTTQQLPAITLNSSTKKIDDSLFYYNFSSAYNHSYQRLGLKKQRADFYPKFSLPHKVKNYLTIEPFLGLRETLWHVDDPAGAYKKNILNREIYDTGFNISSNVFRIYSLNGPKVDRIKHLISPNINYSYTPSQNQDKYPDTIGKQNRISYSLTNTFTSRSKQFSGKKTSMQKKNRAIEEEPNQTKTGEEVQIRQELSELKPTGHTYRQFCYVSLSQSYDINEAKENIPANRSNKNKKQPFSPISGTITILPTNYLSIKANASRSLYESFYRSHNQALTISDKRGDSLSLEHRYTHNSSESIATGITFKLLDNLKGSAEYERNLHNHENITKALTLLYIKQCWSIKFNYIKTYDDEEQVAFTINFHGLGEFGKSI